MTTYRTYHLVTIIILPSIFSPFLTPSLPLNFLKTDKKKQVSCKRLAKVGGSFEQTLTAAAEAQTLILRWQRRTLRTTTLRSVAHTFSSVGAESLLTLSLYVVRERQSQAVSLCVSA